MSSKDRLVCAINYEEPDHVPLYLRVCGRGYLLDEEERWSDQFSRVKHALKLGLDDTVGFVPQLPLNPEVRVKSRKIMLPREKYPVLVKEYETPKGVLRQVVRQTHDWPHGDDIPVFSDHNVPPARSIEYLVKSERDLEALQCLFTEPTAGQMEDFHREAEKVKDFAEKHDVLVECGGVGGSYEDLALGADAAIWLCGVRKIVMMAYRSPGFLHQLLGIIHEWDMMRIRMVLECGGVDVMGHRAWYEGAFFSPTLYKRFIAPLIKEEVEAAHKAGVKYGYIVTRGLMPLLKILKELGIDIIFGVDPVQDNVNLSVVKREVGDDICLWGGVNSYITLSGAEEHIKSAVRYAIQTLAPGGGFILSAVDAVLEEAPSRGLRAMIEAWREYADYPIRG